jgi:hypothetical protein
MMLLLQQQGEIKREVHDRKCARDQESFTMTVCIVPGIRREGEEPEKRRNLLRGWDGWVEEMARQEGEREGQTITGYGWGGWSWVM